MLETIRVLFHESDKFPPLRHDVIFLFNGAEEAILPASHGFITQHPWSPHVKEGQPCREAYLTYGVGYLEKGYFRITPKKITRSWVHHPASLAPHIKGGKPCVGSFDVERLLPYHTQCCESGFWDPGWVKSKDPDPVTGMNNPDHIS